MSPENEADPQRLEITRGDGVAVITLDHPPANAIDGVMIEALYFEIGSKSLTRS